jgi:hypothetical protein
MVLVLKGEGDVSDRAEPTVSERQLERPVFEGVSEGASAMAIPDSLPVLLYGDASGKEDWSRRGAWSRRRVALRRSDHLSFGAERAQCL